MIPFASQRGGGQDLATHLQNSYDNELTEVAELRGAIASDLHGAFREWEAQAETLTRCSKYLYSLSINPDPAQGELTREQYRDYIRRAEDALGLTGQPRAVVFHIKHGREHCHVVWSRIDAERGKAVHIAFDRETLMQVTREFAKKHFLELPHGYEKSRQKGQDSLYERVQKSQTGLSKEDHIERVSEAWRHSDNARSFVQALAERGYILATGKRPYVVVDFYGGMHSLAKLIGDTTVRTKELRAFFARDFPEDSLPSIEEAEELAAKYRLQIEKRVSEGRNAERHAELNHAQNLRRQSLTQQRTELIKEHVLERDRQIARHRLERHEERRAHIEAMRTVRVKRQEFWRTGLARFLGAITGVNAIRRAVHRYQDGKLLEIQHAQRSRLAEKQREERQSLSTQQSRQKLAADRKLRSLEKIEKREANALARDLLKMERIRQRGPEDEMPSLEKTLSRPAKKEIDMQSSFQQARDWEAPQPELKRDFDKAATNPREHSRSKDDRTQGGDGPERER